MDTATDRTSALQRAVFEDGLGKRHHAVTPGGDPLEVLELRYELSNEACEAALRERVNALAGVQSACFARVRGVQRINQNTSKLFVLSDRVNGARLSTVLTVARQPMVALDVNASLCLIRQLVSAVAILHEKMPTFAHGAIAPERIVVTPEARLVVVDHALGAALAQLNYSHERYWKELRVPLPPGAEPAFDQRTDVMQIGTVALELLLGRQLDCAEYPDFIDELTQRAWKINANATGKPLSVPLRAWLLRTLQIDKERSFSTVDAAWEELELVLGGGMGASFTALETVMAEYARKVAAPTTVTTAPAPAAATTPAPAAAPTPAQTPASSEPAPIAGAPVAAAAMAAVPVEAAPLASDRKPSIPTRSRPVDPAIASGWQEPTPVTTPFAAPTPTLEPAPAPAPIERELDAFASNRLVTPSLVTSYEAEHNTAPEPSGS
jgi:hypothetical protein